MSKKTRTNVIFACVIVALVLVMLYSGLRILESTVFYHQSEVTMQTESKTLSRDGVKYFPRQDITVVMFLGIGWEGEAVAKEMNHGGAVDMAALLVFDPKTEECTIVSLNRDMMVDMPILNETGKQVGTYYGQLAYSHTYGTGVEDSCENTRTTISNLMYGLQIDYYFALNMDAISILNDAVDGVTVTITEDLTSADPGLTMGKVTLKGEQARRFVQARTTVSDGTNLSRMRRQEEYMRNFVSALKEKTEKDSTFVIHTYDAVSDYMVTDCTPAVFSRLAEDYGDYAIGATISPEGKNVMGEEYMEYYVDTEALDTLILDLFYAPKK